MISQHKRTLEQIKKAYKPLEDGEYPCYTFGDFVQIKKFQELVSPKFPTIEFSSDVSSVPAATFDYTPAIKVEDEIDYAGLFICPVLENGRMQAIVVTVSNEERLVPIECLVTWLESPARHLAFFDRPLYLEHYFQSGLKLIRLGEVAPARWKLGVMFGSGLKIITSLVEAKLRNKNLIPEKT